MTDVINSVTAVLVYAAWLFAFIFVVGYTTVAKWWRSEAGRTVFALGFVGFGVSTLAALSQIFGQEYGARPWIRFCVWGAKAVVMLGLCVALWRAQGRRRK